MSPRSPDPQVPAPAAASTLEHGASAQAPGGRPRDPRVLKALRILEDAREPPPGLGELAAQVGLSEFHFARKFRDEVGQSVGGFVRGVRLGHAAFRLRTTDAPLHTLCLDYGYASPSAFTRAFTAHHGLSPNRFRKLARAEQAGQAGEGGGPAHVRLERRPGRDAFVSRYLGPFGARERAWDDFVHRVRAAAPAVAGGFFGLTQDDPRSCAPQDFRYDCGFAPEGRGGLGVPPPGFEAFRTTAGLYATLAYSGPYGGVGAAYRALIDRWIRSQRAFTIAGEPLIETFLSPPPTTPDAACTLDLSLKIAPRGAPPDWYAGSDQRREAEQERAALRRRARAAASGRATAKPQAR